MKRWRPLALRGLSLIAAALAAALAVALLAAAPAAAADGIGLWGRADDKVVTLWGLALVVFFPLLITALSLLQHRLESRKERRKRDLARFGRG